MKSSLLCLMLLSSIAFAKDSKEETIQLNIDSPTLVVNTQLKPQKILLHELEEEIKEGDQVRERAVVIGCKTGEGKTITMLAIVQNGSGESMECSSISQSTLDKVCQNGTYGGQTASSCRGVRWNGSSFVQD